MPRKKNDKPEPPPSPAAQALSPKITRSPTFAHYYASQIGILTTTFDVSLMLGRITGVDENGALAAEQIAQVTMSYQHAKALWKLLQDNVEAYERANNIELPYRPVPTAPSS